MRSTGDAGPTVDEVYQFIRTNPYWTSTDLAQHFRISQPTLSPRTKALLEDGRVKKQRVGNESRWRAWDAMPLKVAAVDTVFEYIKENPGVKSAAIMLHFNISAARVSFLLSPLKREGLVESIGRGWRCPGMQPLTEAESLEGLEFNEMITRPWVSWRPETEGWAR